MYSNLAGLQHVALERRNILGGFECLGGKGAFTTWSLRSNQVEYQLLDIVLF